MSCMEHQKVLSVYGIKHGIERRRRKFAELVLFFKYLQIVLKLRSDFFFYKNGPIAYNCSTDVF